MTSALVRTKKIGGSLMVTIPKEIVKEDLIKENQIIEIEIKAKRKDFFGSMKGIGPFTKKDELDTHA